MSEQVFRRQYGKVKYSNHLERKFEIRDTESMEAFKEGIPEVVLPYTVKIGVGYWSNGVLGIYAEVFELGARQMLEEEFTAETPVHIDSLVDNLVNASVDLSRKSTRNRPAMRSELIGELKEKLRYATRSGIEELIVG